MKLYQEWTGPEAEAAGAKKWRIFWWSYGLVLAIIAVVLNVRDRENLIDFFTIISPIDLLWALGSFALFVLFVALAISELMGLLVFRFPFVMQRWDSYERELVWPHRSIVGFFGTVVLGIFYLVIIVGFITQFLFKSL